MNNVLRAGLHLVEKAAEVRALLARVQAAQQNIVRNALYALDLRSAYHVFQNNPTVLPVKRNLFGGDHVRH